MLLEKMEKQNLKDVRVGSYYEKEIRGGCTEIISQQC